MGCFGCKFRFSTPARAAAETLGFDLLDAATPGDAHRRKPARVTLIRVGMPDATDFATPLARDSLSITSVALHALFALRRSRERRKATFLPAAASKDNCSPLAGGRFLSPANGEQFNERSYADLAARSDPISPRGCSQRAQAPAGVPPDWNPCTSACSPHAASYPRATSPAAPGCRQMPHRQVLRRSRSKVHQG